MNVHPKVVGASLAGALTIILVWALHAFARVEIPPEVASAITTVFSSAAGYLVPDGGQA